MKVLVLGAGSIGQRHAKNLLGLGYEVILYEPIWEAFKKVPHTCYSTLTDSYKSALNHGCDVAFVCSPPNFHVKQAIDCIKKGMHVFIEKPLSHNLAGITNLYRLAKEKKRIIMVACNYRFLNALQHLKKRKIYGCQINYGSYLPNWRKTSYKKGYATKKETGGGVILDAGIHQIDLALWLFGKAHLVKSYAKKQSSLKIETEDYADLILQHDNKTMTITTIHVDYLSKTRHHTIRFIGEKGTTEIEIPADPNMYLEEIKYFFGCIKQKKQPNDDGWRALEIALEARQ